jgi:hypothetical protein
MRDEPFEKALSTPPYTGPHFAEAAELKAALAAAERRYLAGHDPERLAAAALYLHARARLFEEVLRAADLYLHSGQGEHEHGTLVRAVARAKEGPLGDLNFGRL